VALGLRRLGLGVNDRRRIVGVLAAARQIAAVEEAGGTAAVQDDGDLVARESRTSGQHEVLVAAVLGDADIGRRRVKRLRAFVLILVVAQYSAGTDANLGH